MGVAGWGWVDGAGAGLDLFERGVLGALDPALQLVNRLDPLGDACHRAGLLVRQVRVHRVPAGGRADKGAMGAMGAIAGGKN